MHRLLLLPLGLALTAPLHAADPATTTQVVRVYTRDRALIQRVASEHSHMIVDRAKGVVVFEADPMQRAWLASAALEWDVDTEATRALEDGLRAATGAKSIPNYQCYRTVAETRTRLAELAAQYPALASVIDIGDSWEKTITPAAGEDLRVLRLTNAAIGGEKPKLFIMTSVHAREYTPAELGLRFGEWLLAGYGHDADATWILDHQEVHLLVQANPDGRKQAENGLSWRKNTNTGYCGSTSTSRGADLNRNWPFKWGQAVGGGGSSPSPCSDTYRGPLAASEPETTATAAYVRTLFPDRRGPGDGDPAAADTQGLFFDIHSYSELVLWPWGWTALGATAPNAVPLEALGRRFAFYNGYTPEQSNELYATDGTTDDTAYGELGVAAYTFEMGTAFFQDCALFENTIYPDNLRALVFAARATRAPYLLAAGPDARAVVSTPDLALAGEAVTITATFDDTRFSNDNGGTQSAQSVASARAWIGTPSWSPGATAIPMVAVDGNWNQSTEVASAGVAGAGLPLGRSLVWVQGRDAAGNDGPPAAAFVNVYATADVGTLGGVVRSAASGLPLAGARIGAGNWQASSAAGGSYVRRLPAGTYDLSASAAGFEPLTVPALSVTGGGTLTRDLSLYALCRILGTDAESGPAGWTAQSPWAISAGATTQTGSRAWLESPGNYANNANTSLVSPTFDLGGYSVPQLSFDSWCDTESGWDYGNVEYSLDGGNSWSTPAWRCNGDASLRHVVVDLPALAGVAQAKIRFHFTSDTSVVRDGWYVDNIVLEAGGPACRATQGPGAALFADGFEP